MSEVGKRAIDKLKMIKNMSEMAETKEIAKIMIEYIQDSEKGTAGFTSEGDKK